MLTVRSGYFRRAVYLQSGDNVINDIHILQYMDKNANMKLTIQGIPQPAGHSPSYAPRNMVFTVLAHATDQHALCTTLASRDAMDLEQSRRVIKLLQEFRDGDILLRPMITATLLVRAVINLYGIDALYTYPFVEENGGVSDMKVLYHFTIMYGCTIHDMVRAVGEFNGIFLDRFIRLVIQLVLAQPSIRRL